LSFEGYPIKVHAWLMEVPDIKFALHYAHSMPPSHASTTPPHSICTSRGAAMVVWSTWSSMSCPPMQGLQAQGSIFCSFNASITSFNTLLIPFAAAERPSTPLAPQGELDSHTSITRALRPETVSSTSSSQNPVSLSQIRSFLILWWLPRPCRGIQD
jgi:hypothetical protein